MAIAMKIGQSVRAKLFEADASGDVAGQLPAGVTVTWESSDEHVCTVTEDYSSMGGPPSCLITAVGAGHCTVFGDDGVSSARIDVDVSQAASTEARVLVVDSKPA